MIRRNLRLSLAKRLIHTSNANHASSLYASSLPFNVDDGLGDFLTPDGCRMLAVDYQNGLRERIKDLSAGTPFAGMNHVDIVIGTANMREHTLLFKYASLALNNSFFLTNLRPPNAIEPAKTMKAKTQYNEFFAKVIKEFGSKDGLQSSMSAAAEGISSSGWIWLVSDQNSALGIIATYGPGTILVRSRQHRIPLIRNEIPEGLNKGASDTMSVATPAPVHSNSPPPPSSSPVSGTFMHPPAPLSSPRTQSRSLHTGSEPDNNLDYTKEIPGGVSNALSYNTKTGDYVNPLLCISVYEHAWLGSGYGVWGKAQYLRNFWSVVNWQRVAEYWSKWNHD